MSVVTSKYRGTPGYMRVHAELVHAAEYRGVTTYQDLAVIMGLPLRGNVMGKAIGQMLAEICEDEVNAGRPMLTAVAISVTGKAGRRFFGLAKYFGRFGDDPGEEQGFWRQECQAVYQTWKRPLHKPSIKPSAPAGDVNLASLKESNSPTPRGEVRSGCYDQDANGNPADESVAVRCDSVLVVAASQDVFESRKGGGQPLHKTAGVHLDPPSASK